MELRDYLNVMRARKWTIILAVATLTITALVVSLLQAPVYEGEAKILIAEKSSGADIFGSLGLDVSSQPERGLQTQVQLMQVRPLLENTIRRLDLGVTPEELAKRVTVAAVGQTNIVSVTAQDGSAERAAEIANTLADEFVMWSRDAKREAINSAAVEVEARLETSKQEILDLGRKIKAQGKSDDLSAELAIATGNYTTLAAKLEELRISAQLEEGSGRVVSPAAVSAEPVEPSPLRNTVLGLVVGLVFGLGMAFLYEYLDNTIKSSEETERILGAPVLGVIPAEKYGKDEKRRTTILTNPGGAAAESFRVLRNNLDFVNFEHNIKTVLITSAAPSEGKSTVAANLAASMAQAGKKVVLLATDFRKPTTQQFFGVRNIIGLSDVLTGEHSLKSALQHPIEGLELMVLTSGKLPPNPSELLGSEKMKALIEELEAWADWVIIDSPPLLAVADGSAVARHTDGVLLVTKAGESTREAGKSAKAMLENAGAHVIGCVVWSLEPGPSGGGYGYRYGTYGAYAYGGYSYADYYNTLDQTGTTKGGSARGMRGGERDARAALRAEAGSLDEVQARTTRAVIVVFVVIVGVALAVYFLDQALGWGIASTLL